MIITFLHDLTENAVGGVIISEITDSEQIQDIIDYVKESKPGEYSSEDIIEALPDDCNLIFTSDCPSVEW